MHHCGLPQWQFESWWDRQTDGQRESQFFMMNHRNSEPDRTEDETGTGHAETDSFSRLLGACGSHTHSAANTLPLSPSSSSLHPSLHQSGVVRSTEPSLFGGSGKWTGNGAPARSHATAAAAQCVCVCVFSPPSVTLPCRKRPW